MARILIYMISALIVLNGLTFVYVVSLGPDPETAEGADAAAGSPAAPSPRGVPESSLKLQLERASRKIDSLQKSVERDLRTLSTKISTLEGRLASIDRKADQIVDQIGCERRHVDGSDERPARARFGCGAQSTPRRR